MAGRNHVPPAHAHLLEIREVAVQRGHLPPPPPPPPSHILVQDPRLRGAPDRIAAHKREIQTLLHDNQHLAATRRTLEQDLSLAQQELRHLSAAAHEVKNDRTAEVRQVYERSLKLEADVQAIEAHKAELREVRLDVEKLTDINQDLTTKLETVNAELAKAKSELKDFPAIKDEIEAMQQELRKGRAAVEFEKKTHATNLEQGRAMKKNMISLASEIDKLQAELANAEKRARAAAAAAAAANPSTGYMSSYGIPSVMHGGSSYPSQYGMHQIQVGLDPAAHYGPGSGGHGSFDGQ
ncbi:hypothetical protein Droror1_Dr00019044 [Drosera rotundifolia]